MVTEVLKVGENYIVMTQDQAKQLANCLLETAEEAKDHEESFPLGIISESRIHPDDVDPLKMTFWVKKE